MSSAYHPQIDGHTEVVNCCLEQYLRSFIYLQPRKWSSYLPWAKYWYNTTYHSSTGMTPFQALYGHSPPTIPHYQEGTCVVHEVDQQLVTRDALFHQLKSNFQIASNRIKQGDDSNQRDVKLQEGDMVFLKLHPYRQQSVHRRACQKLASRFYGPFPVEEKIGKVACRLKLPPGSRIHPVFHVSMLKKQIGGDRASSLKLPLFLMMEKLLQNQNKFFRHVGLSKVSLSGAICQRKMPRGKLFCSLQSLFKPCGLGSFARREHVFFFSGFDWHLSSFKKILWIFTCFVLSFLYI